MASRNISIVLGLAKHMSGYHTMAGLVSAKVALHSSKMGLNVLIYVHVLVFISL